MIQNVKPRDWDDIGRIDKIIRAFVYIGAGAFILGGMIGFGLGPIAADQPVVAIGIYQYPYSDKATVHFLTKNQYDLVKVSRILLFGWGVAVAAGILSKLSEQIAAERAYKQNNP